MSTIRHPVGPQPKRVYWRRRLVVLLGLVAIIVIVVLIIVRPGSGSGTPAPVATGTSTSTAPPAAPSATPTPAPAAAGTPSAVDTTSTTPPAQVAACAAGNISLTPVTDAASYAAGSQPMLSFSVTNTGSQPCKINAGTSQQVYTITSGAETYWVSTDCQTNPTDTEAVLEPNVAVVSTPFAWDRTRSSPSTCSSTTRPQVPAGGASYHLGVKVAGIDSGGTKQFVLN